MNRYTPQLLGLALIVVGGFWIHVMETRELVFLPALLLLAGGLLAYFGDLVAPPSLPDLLAAEDPEPWKRPPAANAEQARAYGADSPQIQALAPQAAPGSGTLVAPRHNAPTAPEPMPSEPMNPLTPVTPLDEADAGTTRAAPSAVPEFTVADAIDPATPWDVQAEIARTRPDLRAALAKNPALYPDLRAWLDRHINE